MTQTQVNPLGTRPVGRLMIEFAVPSIVSLVVNSLYNMVNQIFIGQGVGFLGNAATNVIMPITLIVTAAAMMLGTGASALMSLFLGQGESGKAARSVGNMITLLAASGAFFLVVFYIALRPMCRVFGATDDTLPYALDYGRIIALGFPGSMLAVTLGGIIRADGRPMVNMMGMLVGCIINLILDPLFIFVFHWGVKGAAFATIIGQYANAAIYIYYMTRLQTVRIARRDFVPEPAMVRRILSLGMSSFFTQIAASLVIGIQNNLLVKYGAQSVYGADIPMAALGITMKTSNLITSVAMGIASGVQPIVGYNYGSGQHERVKRTFTLSMVSCLVIMAAAFVAFQVFPDRIVLIFGQESELYMDFAVKCFRIYLLACVMIPVGMVISTFMQSVGQAFPAMVLSLTRQVLMLIPATIVLGALLGIDGILWAGPVSDTLAAVIAVIMLRAKWRRIFAAPDNSAVAHAP